jgi:hypothetical protein
MRKAFHVGGNSSCRQHIRQHYDIYRKRCQSANIKMNDRAIPPAIVKARKEKEEGKGGKQTKLDDNFAQMPSAHLKEFTREGVVDAVARFIVLDDQVFPNNTNVQTLLIIRCSRSHLHANPRSATAWLP